VAWVKGRARNGPASLQAGSELVKRIEGLQPFNRRVAEDHPLARLVSHTNNAKHRAPAVTAVRMAAMYDEDQRPRSLHDLPTHPEVPLQAGDVIAETPVGTQVVLALFPTIGINRPGTSRWPILMKELDEISGWVREQAVPRLITGAEPIQPALPTHYNISVGHDDERQAMSTGSLVSAPERHQQRLGAAAARNDLVGILNHMDGSLGAEQISGWLADLPDPEVLKRMARLTSSDAPDAAIVLRNLKVLEGLCREAAAFTMNKASSQ
jgi:hypothetical protein